MPSLGRVVHFELPGLAFAIVKRRVLTEVLTALLVLNEFLHFELPGRAFTTVKRRVLTEMLTALLVLDEVFKSNCRTGLTENELGF